MNRPATRAVAWTAFRLIVTLSLCLVGAVLLTAPEAKAAAFTPTPNPSVTAAPSPTPAGRLIFEQDNGLLRGAARASLITNIAARLLDFRLEVSFINPYDGDSTFWTYGIGFGVVENTAHVFLISADGTWSLVRSSSDGASTIHEGYLKRFDTAPQSVHTIQIKVAGRSFQAWLDGQLIANLTLKESPARGSILVAGAASPQRGDQVIIRYRQLRVYDLEPHPTPTASPRPK